MKFWLWVYVSFWGFVWSILGRMREAREGVPDADAVECSVRMVVLYAIQEL